MHRMLMMVALVASAAVPWPAQAQQVSAEKLFQQMGKKLQDAKTVQFGFKVNMASGKLVLGEGDKFRLDSEGFIGSGKSTVVGDGTKIFNTDDIGSMNSPKNVGAYFRGSLVRVGLWGGSIELKNAPEPADTFAVSDFKLGAKENLNGVETQVIEYKVTLRGDDITFNVKMWVAVKSSLPVKLELRFKAMGGVLKFSETYTDWVLDAKVDPKLFQPPQ
jgi:outer membrane lipoprotein-sorting protein